ncbi:MAG: ATP-dependent 6-phosphofructokinase [Pirellulales bacterium]
MITQEDLLVPTLGERRQRSPLPLSTVPSDGVGDFVPDEMRVLYEICFRSGQPPPDLAFERAGPRQHLFFDPPQTRAAIVTAGGLCPGINNVIRTLFFELTTNYGVAEVVGIRFGFEGLNPTKAKPPITLNDEIVAEIHHLGGTILGTSRGPHNPQVTAKFLHDRQIDMLFCVGGDGTQRGAHEIATEIAGRKLPIAIVGIPKTIDNDIKYCRRSFGFATAVAEAETVVNRAHTEATGVLNGVGLVKLMGRESGYIAAGATIASGDVNFTLIPEAPFQLDGPKGLLVKLESRLAARQHAVIVVAEGAGQDLIPDLKEEYDASGNRVLGDIGAFLKQRITEHFRNRELPIQVRYFDPSYYIRSCPPNAVDSLLCEQFARHAVHAALAGKTDIVVGLWHGEFIHVPLRASIGQKKRLSPEDEWWMTVLAITGQEKW